MLTLEVAHENGGIDVLFADAAARTRPLSAANAPKAMAAAGIVEVDEAEE